MHLVLRVVASHTCYEIRTIFLMRHVCHRICLFSQSREKIGGHFANAFDPFFLLAQFFFAESQEGPPFQLSLSSSMRR